MPLTKNTFTASSISDSTTAGRALLTAGSVQAQRTALDIFLSYANLASFPASGNLQRLYLALDTAKTYVWNGTGYTEVSPNNHVRAGGFSNVNVGETALSSAVLFGSNNTAVGTNALAINDTGSSNSAVGTNALANNLLGNFNTAVGVSALQLTNANNNTAHGYNALALNQTGVNNTAIGSSSLQACTSFNNTGVGQGSLFGCTSGNSNAGLGLNAGGTINTGSTNTLLGTQSDVDSGARSNCVVIGANTISPAVNGSLSIGANTGSGNEMTNLVTSSGGSIANQDLIIYLNGTRYRIALKT
jgi:hypothetical protein